MDDAQLWQFEDSLWKADEAHYRESIADECLMVVPQPPYLLTGEEAVRAVANTPRWSEVAFTGQRVARFGDALAVIAYRVRAARSDADPYEAHCTSTYLAEGDAWRVVQHQQTPLIVSPAATR